MKMKKNNIVTVLIALLLVIALLPSCDFIEHKNEDVVDETANSGVTGLTAKKLFQYDGYEIKKMYNEYFVYQNEEENKFGVKSFSGEDSFLEYDYTYERDGMLVVSTSFYSKFKKSNAVSDINVFGIYNSHGKRLAGCDYAGFKRLNDRYIEAYKVLAPAPDGAENVLRKGESSVGNYSDGQAYTYDKVVIDTETAAIVDGSKINYFGEYSYRNENKSFDDGSYVIRGTETDTVYNVDGEKLFEYDPDEYSVNDYDSGYYIAEKIVDGVSEYYVLDTDGSNLTSGTSGFNKKPEVLGSVFSANDSNYNKVLYDAKGNKITQNVYKTVYFDELSKDLIVAKTDKEYVFINGKGEVLLRVPDKNSDNLEVYAVDGLAYEKKEEGGYSFYNFAEKDYTITAYLAYSVTNLLVKTTDGDSRYDLIDATNGNRLCKGYMNYLYSPISDGSCAIAAERIEGGYDIIRVQNKIDAVKNSFADDEIINANRLNKIYKVKEDLFADLESALKDVGLTASIDRDNGEVAFDTAVVFAGDSSTISEEGKKLLDSFTKAYSAVLGNEKYKGFISKTIVEGHTAPLAESTYESGLPLSKERAENVTEYCKSVDPVLANTFEAIGYSNSRPVYNADGTINQDASRRVTFKCVINSDYQA